MIFSHKALVFHLSFTLIPLGTLELQFFNLTLCTSALYFSFNQAKMGPRALSSERAITNVGFSSQPFNRANFLGAKQEARYTELASRNIWQELAQVVNPSHRFNYEIMREFYSNALPIEVKFLRKDMNVNAQVLMTLLLYNIRPMSHTSSIPVDTACLLYYILDERHAGVVIPSVVHGTIEGFVNYRYIHRNCTPRGQLIADAPVPPPPPPVQQ
ncbi:hypothetical protein KIW84_052328 [Lathyrus oleraceus]|uniref:Uncharacterized protein n=1 Tax=Pisum sativum TaxID=3888 RepID=A0A9D4WPT3_PEA|nr:hypothetical protein KIW84_052328 [Pisum sativum]